MRNNRTRVARPEPYVYSANRPARLLVVDDHPLMREAIAARLRSSPDLVVAAEASGLREAVAALSAGKFEAAIIDVSLDDGDGIQLVRRLRTTHPSIRTLVLSMFTEEVYGVRAIRAGAWGYVNKHESSTQIIAAIRTILAGEFYVSAGLNHRLIHMGPLPDDHALDPVNTLTDRELEIYSLIGDGIGTREIATRLHLSPHTIDTHKEHLKEKLGCLSGTELQRSAILWLVEQS